jgi:glyoxylase-like metal-dependent hydrolase (beta-lactamase superfamily II)
VSRPWREIAADVFIRRYLFYDQTIGAVVGRDGLLVVDTRTTHRQADELVDELRALTRQPATIVVNTHFHHDHTFGNHRFRPAVIWAHERCASMLRETFDSRRAALIAELPALAEDLATVVLDPPDRTFAEQATLDVGGRAVELRHLGRGHTDNDVVALVPDSDVLFAGDLLENGAAPNFGDAFPLDWPATGEALVQLAGERTVVVPGHGEPVDRAFAAAQVNQIRAIAELAGRVSVGELDLRDAVRVAPFGPAASLEPLERALAHLRGKV